MAKNNEQQEKTVVENINERITGAERAIESHKKIMLWIVAAVVAIACVVLGYVYLYQQPREEKAATAYGAVDLKAQGNDSIAAAEYMKVANQYSGTDGGNLAALQAGEILYRLKRYKDAAKYLEMFSTGEPVMQANATCLLGDCQVNLKQYDNALSTYQKALGQANENPQIAPRVMMKMANIYEFKKDNAKALETYEAIQADYPGFRYGLGMDAYIQRAKTRMGK